MVRFTFAIGFCTVISAAVPSLGATLSPQSSLEKRYESGECSANITQYQKNPQAPPGDNSTRYRFDVNLTDSTGHSVGSVVKTLLDTSSNPIIPSLSSDADGYIVVKDELPYPFIIDPLETSLIFRYGFQTFSSSSTACTWLDGVSGRYELGSSLRNATATGNCTFPCVT